MKKRILLSAIALILILCFQVSAFADFGDYAGDSDWGWSDSGDSWGSSDWGSSDWDSSDWDSSDDWGSSYDSYNYSSWGYSSAGGYDGFGNVITLIIAVVIIVVYVVRFFKSGGSKKTVKMERPVSSNMVNDIASLKKRDPSFSESRFLEDASNLYVRIQNAWTARDLTPVRTRLSSELYAKTERQLETMRKNGQTDHVDKISVLSSDIIGCTDDGTNDIITVQISSRITDYVTSDSTGEVIRGNPNRELFMTYQWTFIRTIGRQTRTASGDVDKKCCPNCGAPLDLNQSSVCAYCGTVVETGDYDWVLSSIKGISQKSS